MSVVFLLFSNAALRRRVSALEARLSGLSDAPGRGEAAVPLAESGPNAAVEALLATRPAAPSEPEPPDPSASEPAAPEPAALQPAHPATGDPNPPRAVVFNAETFGALGSWVAQNWFYVISAISLALAGIFLVQYGIEKGVLPPWLRVTAALLFGMALIGAGEVIRRRFGDTEDTSTAYLPSTFSSAGIVTLFGAVLAARTLYDLIGAELALVGMALVGATALVFGWFYGPLLAAIGVIGAMAAPFVVGGTSEDPSWLFVYFLIVATVGLAIDTVRRWAWVSVISLVLGFGAGLLLVIGTAQLTEPGFILFCIALALAAIAIPVRRLLPDHGGTPLSLALLATQTGQDWPEFPTRLAAGAILAASALIALGAFDTARPDIFWTAVLGLSGLTLALLVWARRAPALVDLTTLPAAALVAVVVGGARIWAVDAEAARLPEADMPLLPSVLVGIGLALSAVAAWRSLRGGDARVFVAAGAAIAAPAIAIAIEVAWAPAEAIGPYAWSLHAMAIAALMVGMAERFARADGPDDRLRTSIATLSALASVAFGLILLFSSAALTIALALTVVAAAALDRRFDLPLMGLYILAGVATVGYRLVADPGLGWALYAPLPDMLLSHGGATAGFALSWWLLSGIDRPHARVVLESAAVSSAGLLLTLLLHRTIEASAGVSATESHWSYGLGATIWIALGLAQLRRLSIGGPLRTVRLVLSGLFLLIGVGMLLVAALLANPVLLPFAPPVLGPAILNTLLPAYLVPSLVLALGARWLHDLPRPLLVGMRSLAAALASLWLPLAIRHFWRGAEGMADAGIEQPELYSYTVALLAVGAALFYLSLARRSAWLRRLGLLVIGLAVAKVFLVDIAGLGGLIRVFSLLLLGLALAGLAWLDRWATKRGRAPG